jgi:hypothetical protein
MSYHLFVRAIHESPDDDVKQGIGVTLCSNPVFHAFALLKTLSFGKALLRFLANFAKIEKEVTRAVNTNDFLPCYLITLIGN